MHIWLWEHYPVNPSATEQFQNNFTTDYIFLQDVADQQLVSQYAEDAFARQPLISGDRSAVRLPRQKADMKAKDITNYFYNRQVWDNIQYPTDMWNEPLICFRVDAVYDRGVYDHASITLNNHKLTMANAILFGNELENPNINKTNKKYSIIDFQALKLSMTTVLLNSQMGLIHLDGKNFQLPSWREAWGF